MTEREWQRQVIEIAETLGYRVMHVRHSVGRGGDWTTATSIVGWPDLVCVPVRHPERGVAALELKSDTGRVTADQEQVLAELAAAGVRTMVARPADVDRVIALLR